MPPRAKPVLKPQLELLSDIRNLIEQARHQAVLAVNAELSLLYWNVGTRINQEVLKNNRAEYGKQIIQHLATDLSLEYGSGWSAAQLRHCLQFAKIFPDSRIVSALRRQLSWTKIKTLLYIKDDLKRTFYLEMTQLENWSSRQLQERINSQLFERTALSKKPEETIRADLEQLLQTKKITPEILLKDPYILDFLGLKDRYLEKDLEDTILREIELFLLELGAGFTFVARQKRITLDNEDFYIDLLLFNRKLQRLVLIELKLGDFQAADKGQVELYLRYLAKYEQEPHEQSPLAIILCTGKKQEQIELLELDKSGIHVAEYLTELPPRALLMAKLAQSLEAAKERLGNAD